MKKILALLLVLMIAVPAALAVCSCCRPAVHHAAAEISSVMHCPCPSLPLLAKDHAARIESWVQHALHQVKISGPESAVPGKNFSGSKIAASVFTADPLSAAASPLYLSLNVLRI